MKNRGMKIGEPFGIGVYIHWSFWLLVAYYTFGAMGTGGLPAMLSGLAMIIGVFSCVVLHELGHSLAARFYGIATDDITLYPIGGVARLQRMPHTPTHEMVIAIAGPLVNVAIALILGGLILVGLGDRLIQNLLYVNLMLVFFNLIPAFPMDGGRIFRAFLSLFVTRQRATNIAATTGKIFASFLVLSGIFGQPFLIVLGVFIWMAGEGERRYVVAESTRKAPSMTPPMPGNIIVPEIIYPEDPRYIRR